ncbi:unnamed protein product [Effrenium voratum]|uniref:UBC core domain-containing protein n=1 Tax=Effrenium voratum TaxID=2562239 RepID=A0AA36J0F0_9DINO|nr:unnamed protein product [Effrenium voratum]
MSDAMEGLQKDFLEWKKSHPSTAVELLSAEEALVLQVDSFATVLLMRVESSFFLEAQDADEEVEEWATELNSLFAEKPKFTLADALQALVTQLPRGEDEEMLSQAIEPETKRRACNDEVEESKRLQSLSAQGSRQASQVLMREMRALHALQGDGGACDRALEVEMVQDSLYHWTVKMHAAGFPDCSLRQELGKYAAQHPTGQAAVVLEVLFPDSFPMEPPFIRIVRPRFQMHTGHITVGGSICMQLLTTSGWLPTVSLENVFVAIRSEMVEGGGRLDFSSCRDYSVQEAREAFQRVARRYGWN